MKNSKRQNDSGFAWIIVIVLILFVTGIVNCQDHIKLHTDREEWENSVGIKFITVTSKDDRLVYFYQVRKYETKISSLGWDKDSRLVDPAKKGFEGCYVTIYCKTHLMIYLLQRVSCFDDDKDKPPD